MTVIIKIKVPMLPLVLPIVGDCHYKDISDNVTTCSSHCDSHQQWEEQVVTLALLFL
jgi:hypothetical protein